MTRSASGDRRYGVGGCREDPRHSCDNLSELRRATVLLSTLAPLEMVHWLSLVQSAD